MTKKKASTKKSRFDEKGEDRSGDVIRGRFPYISGFTIGQKNDKGRIIFSAGYSAIKGKPEHPASSLLVPLVEIVLNQTSWEGVEHAQRDLAVLDHFLHDLAFVNKATGERTPLVPRDEDLPRKARKRRCTKNVTGKTADAGG